MNPTMAQYQNNFQSNLQYNATMAPTVIMYGNVTSKSSLSRPERSLCFVVRFPI
jgi:hypothetical protein